MASREHTVLVWAAAAAAVGLAVWALDAFLPMRSASVQTGAASAPDKPRGDAPIPVATHSAPSTPVAAPTATSDRFKLVGVMISGNDRRVLITVDGKPAGMYRVGETVDGDIVVREVTERGATLGPRQGAAPMALELSLAPPTAGAAVTPPAQTVQVVPRAQLADGSIESQEILRRAGSRHAPLAFPPVSALQKPADAAMAPVDDGRWRPAGQQ